MHNKTLFRLILRNKLQKHTGLGRESINKVLRNKKLFDEVFYRVNKKAGKFGTGDAVTFLEWLLEHWEEILKIIMTVIDLFSREKK